MPQKLINSADLKGWGLHVGESLDRIIVIDDYYCGLCSSSRKGEHDPLTFTDLHTLVNLVLWHLKTEHPGAVPERPEAE